MKEIFEFFRGLFDTSHWPPRWHCGYWSDFHGWLYIISDLTIWAAYFLIPLIILNYLSKKKERLKFQKAYILFAAFILLCGTTHFLDAMMFWVPMYRFNALVRLVTGIVSMFTVYHLFKILPSAFAQKTNLELEKEIAFRQEVEKKLEFANVKLHEANKGLGAFAYIASHDLQEPLRKIQTFSSMLQNNNLDDAGKMHLAKINSASKRMSTLIQDVLSLSILSEEVEMKICDPNKAVNQALKDLEIKIAECRAIIHVDELPKIRGNENYLAQLFANLISNAIKFSDKQPEIWISGERRSAAVIICIRDNGIGIEKENTEKIFNAFYRLHSHNEYDGSGIGLAISKKIVEVHSGKISVQSEPGEGTIFFLEFSAAF